MPFLEDRDDIEAYLVQFERVATLNRWEKEEWGTRLVPLLKGEARNAYIQIPIEDSADYDTIKCTLLRRYQLNATMYRKKFRGTKPRDGEESYVYWERLDHMMKRWIELSNKKEGDLKEMLIMEKFLETQPMDKARFIRERAPTGKEEVIRAAELFDESRLAEKRLVDGKLQSTRVHQNQPTSRPTLKSTTESNNSTANRDNRPHEGGGRSQSYSNYRRGPPTFSNVPRRGCFKCGGQHYIKNCPQNERVSVIIGDSVPEDETQAFTQVLGKKSNSQYYCTIKVEGREAKGLRDTGATQTQVHKDLVPKRCYTGRFKTVRYANNTKDRLPTAIVAIEIPHYRGNVEVLVAEDAPIPVLIGNESDCWEDSLEQQEVQEEIKTAVTTSETQNVQKGRSEQVTDDLRTEDKRTAETVAAINQPSTSQEKKQHPLKVKQSILSTITSKELKEEQRKDSSLDKLWEKARMRDKGVIRSTGTSSAYFIKKGVLHRRFTQQQRTTNQVLVPRKYRTAIIELAHDPPMSGHLGVNKTKERVLGSFHWPGIDNDIRRFCLSCDPCQRAMSRGKPRKAPLQEIPRTREGGRGPGFGDNSWRGEHRR